MAVRYKSGKAKKRRTKSFADRDECVAAEKALRATVTARNAALLAELAEQHDFTRGLALWPPVAEAEPNTPYYGKAKSETFGPERYVLQAHKLPRQYGAACRHGEGAQACANHPVQDAKGEKATLCKAHGGGRIKKCKPPTSEDACPVYMFDNPEHGYLCMRCYLASAAPGDVRM